MEKIKAKDLVIGRVYTSINEFSTVNNEFVYLGKHNITILDSYLNEQLKIKDVFVFLDLTYTNFDRLLGRKTLSNLQESEWVCNNRVVEVSVGDKIGFPNSFVDKEIIEID